MSSWRYGVYLEEFGPPGSTARSGSAQGCINMLGHDLDRFHRDSGECTCSQYRAGRGKRATSPEKLCQPCKDMEVVKDLLKTQTQVVYLGRVWYYQEEQSR